METHAAPNIFGSLIYCLLTMRQRQSNEQRSSCGASDKAGLRIRFMGNMVNYSFMILILSTHDMNGRKIYNMY